jgi:hypothetical protein
MEMKKLPGKFLTISDMANELDISYITAKQRLLRAGIKPITKEAIYHESALEAIRNVPGKGRPKKQPEVKPRAKNGKGKK